MKIVNLNINSEDVSQRLLFLAIRFIRIFTGVPVGLSKTAIFNTFARYFFRSFTGKANIITQYTLLFSRSFVASPLTPQCVNLNDLEWPFYAKFCLSAKFKFKIRLLTYTDSAIISVVKAKIIYLAKITCMRAGSLYKAIKYSKT